MPPWSIALMNGNWDLAKLLIDAGSDVNQWDLYGQGPLNVAIANETVRGDDNPLDQDVPNRVTARDVVKMLVERGRESESAALLPGGGAHDPWRRHRSRHTTPFLSACANGDIEIVKLLLAHGANPRLATSDGQGPIILATTARTAAAAFRIRASLAWRRHGAKRSMTPGSSARQQRPARQSHCRTHQVAGRQRRRCESHCQAPFPAAHARRLGTSLRHPSGQQRRRWRHWST